MAVETLGGEVLAFEQLASVELQAQLARPVEDHHAERAEFVEQPLSGLFVALDPLLFGNRRLGLGLDEVTDLLSVVGVLVEDRSSLAPV